MTQEIWKDIPNYEGYYQVSNLGNVKSLPRIVSNKRGEYVIQERLLSLTKTKRGYFKLNLHKDSKRKTFLLHQIVAMAFLSHKPCGLKKVVDHIDENITNNKVDNLQLLTCRENVRRVPKDKYTSKYKGVHYRKRDKIFVAQIYLNKKTVHLGRYKNEYDAHLAYQKKINEISEANFRQIKVLDKVTDKNGYRTITP
jgi:hypothetical protein